MIERKIVIDGVEVPFRASAAIPRIYRGRFGRDIFKDIQNLSETIENQNGPEDQNEKAGSGISLNVLEVFENVAFIMARHADPTQPDNPEDWLDQYNTFSIYEVLPQLLELWHMNLKTDAKAKKNRSLPPVK